MLLNDAVNNTIDSPIELDDAPKVVSRNVVAAVLCSGGIQRQGGAG